MGGGRGRTPGSCRYRTPKVHAECSREAPGRESRTTMMRRQMGDIGAIANVCNTDLKEPADDSASAGRDEDFHAPTRRYHDISVFMTPPLCSHPQIPTHHRIPARRHGRNPELPTQAGSDSPKRAATTRREPNSGFPPRTSRSNPELRVHLPVAVLSRRPRHSTSRTGSSAPPVTPAAQATPARHLRAYSTLTRYIAPTCPAIAVTVALPRPTVVTMPLWSTFTTLGLVLPHTIPSR